MNLSVEQRDRGGNSATVAHDLLDGDGRLSVLRVRHAVRNDGRLEGNHRPTSIQRFAHLIVEDEWKRVACLRGR